MTSFAGPSCASYSSLRRREEAFKSHYFTRRNTLGRSCGYLFLTFWNSFMRLIKVSVVICFALDTVCCDWFSWYERETSVATFSPLSSVKFILSCSFVETVHTASITLESKLLRSSKLNFSCLVLPLLLLRSRTRSVRGCSILRKSDNHRHHHKQLDSFIRYRVCNFGG